MQKPFHLCHLGTLCLFIFVLILSNFALSTAGAVEASPEAAKIIMASGVVESMSIGGQSWQAIQSGAILGLGDSVRTGVDGRAALLLADESIVRMNHDTLFVLQNVAKRGGDGSINRVKASSPAKEDDRTLLGLIKGELWFLNKNPDEKVDIKTQAMTASLRGTEFDIQVDADGASLVSMLEGTVQVWNELGTVTLNANESAMAKPGFAPQKRILLNPENAVQWTILVPELLHYEEMFQNRSGEHSVARLKLAWDAIAQGDLLQSKEILTGLTTDSPDFAPAWESLALTELLLNDSDTALQAVEKAEKLVPGTPYPLMLLSLIHQARFDLERAEEAIRTAINLDGNNVTALVQLATLLFGKGATEEAMQVMENALRLAPDSAEVNNLQGFILLSLRQEDKAALAFARASKVSPTLAEPHLGLGLIAMRHGEEDVAMTEVTSAVLLEPRRAMLRNYWAKMLYQLGRHEKALDVLNVSLHIDPRDPTPDLYRSIIYRDLRMPGAAITAINEAIRKNDNRAVYRSRLLLDRDLAVKNVDLSQIYDQLGLANWAKVKAVASLDDDYANSSAHLFYAGALTGGDGRSWARDTENLLARLLKPANVNTFNTFNDYTAFFERPSLQGEYTVKAGSNDTLDQDIVAFGALPKANLAYAAGYLPHRTDGWRDDYPERSRSEVGYVKWDPTPKHGLMFSGSRLDISKGGKNSSRFDYYDPPETQDNQNDEIHKFEIGYAYNPLPASYLLLHAAKNRAREWLEDYTRVLDYPPGYNLEVWDCRTLFQPYSQLQGEVLHRYGRHQFILGSSYYHQDGMSERTVDGTFDPPGVYLYVFPPLSFDNHQTFWSTYLHDIWKPNPTLTVELALYNEAMTRAPFFSQAAQDSHELSPRFGLRWQPRPQHTLHLAAFRSLLPFYADYLAPTDIAGVPVQRNGPPGTMTDEADLVWDYELGGLGIVSSTLFYLERSYQEPTADAMGIALLTKNKGGSVVFESLLGETTGVVLSYRYEDIDNEMVPGLDRVDHQLRAGLRWIGQKSWSLGIDETYRLADLRTSLRPNENITLTDLSLEYEFPGKHGALKFELNNLFDDHFNWVVDTFTIGGRVPAREAMLTMRLTY